MHQVTRPAKRPPLDGPFEPHLSRATLDFRDGEHHVGDIQKLNELARGTAGALCNNAAQAWRHRFYRNGLGPHAGGRPEGGLAVTLERALASFDGFRAQFAREALALFGSGWMWRVRDEGSETLAATAKADSPLHAASPPLLLGEVWEHADSLDCCNERARRLAGCWAIANWEPVCRTTTPPPARPEPRTGRV